MNCDKCKHYDWYYDYCEKWKCTINAKEVHSCFDPFEELDDTVGELNEKD